MDGRVVETIFQSPSQRIDKKKWGYGWNTKVGFDKSPVLKGALTELAETIDKTASAQTIWQAVYDSVGFLYPNLNYGDVQDFSRNNRNASLEQYAANKTGNCFQTSLTACLFLEKLQELGYKTGNFRIQQMEVEDPENSGTHVWVEAEDLGESAVMDVAGNYFGNIPDHEETLHEVAKRILWG